MSQKTSQEAPKRTGLKGQSLSQDFAEATRRKRKATALFGNSTEGDEVPTKVSRRKTDENQLPGGGERPSRKRKASFSSVVFGDITNFINNPPQPKISRKATFSQPSQPREECSQPKVELSQPSEGFSQPIDIIYEEETFEATQDEIIEAIIAEEAFIEQKVIEDIIIKKSRIDWKVKEFQHFEILSDLIVDEAQIESIIEEESSSWADAFKEVNHFDNVSDPLIVEIMDYLNANGRLSMAASCKRFNEILKTSPNRLPIKLTPDFDADVPELERIYRFVAISRLITPINQEAEAKVMKIFDQLKQQVTNVKLVRSHLSLEFFNRILKTMPQINSLVLESSVTIDNDPLNETFEPLPLSSLKKVHVNDRNIESMSKILRNVTSLEEFLFRAQEFEHEHIAIEGTDDSDAEDDDGPDFEIIERLPEGNGEELQILDGQGDIFFGVGFFAIPSPNYDEIKEILKVQKNLKLLEINKGKFFENPFTGCTFQLKHLVLFIPSANNAKMKNIREFVETQKELESVVVNILCESNEGNRREMKAILRHITGLSTMKAFKLVFYNGIGIVEFFHDFSFNSFVNRNIKEVYLGLCGRIDQNANFRHTMEAMQHHFPNVESLELCLDDDWVRNAEGDALAPLNSLRFLRKLRVEDLKSVHVSLINIPTLEKATFKHIDESNREHWLQFYRNNPNVKDLNYQFHPAVNVDSVEFVQDMITNLSSIERVHVCNCGNLLSEQQKELIKAIVDTSQTMKRIGFCNWEQLM